MDIAYFLQFSILVIFIKEDYLVKHIRTYVTLRSGGGAVFYSKNVNKNVFKFKKKKSLRTPLANISH